MAAKSSTQITNMDASPASRVDPNSWKGRVMAMVALLEKDAADDGGNALRFFRVHSSWVPLELIVKNDVITSVTDVLDDTAALRADYGEAIWQRLGLSEDPDLYYDLAITVVSTASNGGTIAMMGKFLTGS